MELQAVIYAKCRTLYESLSLQVISTGKVKLFGKIQNIQVVLAKRTKTVMLIMENGEISITNMSLIQAQVYGMLYYV